jgi:hypothetical protein
VALKLQKGYQQAQGIGRKVKAKAAVEAGKDQARGLRAQVKAEKYLQLTSSTQTLSFLVLQEARGQHETEIKTSLGQDSRGGGKIVVERGRRAS